MRSQPPTASQSSAVFRNSCNALLLVFLSVSLAASAQQRTGAKAPNNLSVLPVANGAAASATPGATLTPKIEVASGYTSWGSKDSLTLNATMRIGVTPVNGASLQFKIGSQSVGQAVTDADGKAQVGVFQSALSALLPGAHPIYVLRKAYGQTPEVVGTGTLTVKYEPPQIGLF